MCVMNDISQFVMTSIFLLNKFQPFSPPETKMLSIIGLGLSEFTVGLYLVNMLTNIK